jgi:hypothetical protein
MGREGGLRGDRLIKVRHGINQRDYGNSGPHADYFPGVVRTPTDYASG